MSVSDTAGKPVGGLGGLRRKAVIKAGHALTRGIAHFQTAQSLIGDPALADNRSFPFVPMLEANWEAIRDEALEIIKFRDAVPLFEEISTDQKNISRSSTWRTFFLYGFGEPVARSCKRAPKTAEFLSRIPHLQSAFFSILEPDSHIPPHRGLTKGLLTCHLGLIVPQDRASCRLRVDDQIQLWEPGKVFIFDDTREHEVWNDTKETRVVLLFHVDRPMRPLGATLHRAFIRMVKMSAYVKEPKARIGAFEDRFEAAIRRSHETLENATGR